MDDEIETGLNAIANKGQKKNALKHFPLSVHCSMFLHSSWLSLEKLITAFVLLRRSAMCTYLTSWVFFQYLFFNLFCKERLITENENIIVSIIVMYIYLMKRSFRNFHDYMYQVYLQTSFFLNENWIHFFQY